MTDNLLSNLANFVTFSNLNLTDSLLFLTKPGVFLTKAFV